MDIIDDLKFVVRSLRRQPAFALTAVATLAVGIGATDGNLQRGQRRNVAAAPDPRSDDLRTVADPFIDGRWASGQPDRTRALSRSIHGLWPD